MTKEFGKCVRCKARRFLNWTKLCKKCNKLSTPEVNKQRELMMKVRKGEINLYEETTKNSE